MLLFDKDDSSIGDDDSGGGEVEFSDVDIFAEDDRLGWSEGSVRSGKAGVSLYRVKLLLLLLLLPLL